MILIYSIKFLSISNLTTVFTKINIENGSRTAPHGTRKVNKTASKTRKNNDWNCNFDKYSKKKVLISLHAASKKKLEVRNAKSRFDTLLVRYSEKNQFCSFTELQKYLDASVISRTIGNRLKSKKAVEKYRFLNLKKVVFTCLDLTGKTAQKL